MKVHVFSLLAFILVAFSLVTTGCKLDDNRVVGHIGESNGGPPPTEESPPPPAQSSKCLAESALTNSPYANSGESGIDGSSAEKAFLICTASQFKAIGDGTDWNEYFELGADIDLVNFDGSTVEKTIKPIGNSTTAFYGQFDGGSHTISNFYLVLNGESSIGLFGRATSATIKNLNLSEVYVEGDGSKIGSLVGYALFSTIENVSVTSSSGSPSVKGTSVTSDRVGGLAGEALSSTVINVTSNLHVTSLGGYVGGLIGFGGGTFKFVSASGSVNASTNYAGGLVGYLYGTVIDSKASGNVTGAAYVGGLTGRSGGYIYHSSASGTASGSGDYIGGFAGQVPGGEISNSISTGNVTASATSSYVGGFAGAASAMTTSISNTLSRGNVSGGLSRIGGHTGYHASLASIYYAAAAGDVNGTPGTSDMVGSVFGEVNNANISRAVGLGTVSGATNVGGFAGVHSITTQTIEFARWDTTLNSSLNDLASGDHASITASATGTLQSSVSYFSDGWDVYTGGSSGKNEIWYFDTGLYHWAELSGLPATTFSGGSGTKEDPYLITTKADLKKINLAQNLAKYFKLVNGIDLTGETWNPIGGQHSPFSGELDGNGQTISNLQSAYNNQSYIGLFGKATALTLLKGLNITGVHLQVTDGGYVGALVGRTDGNIENCSVTGRSDVNADIEANNTSAYFNRIGGLAGSASVVTNSYAQNIWVEANELSGTRSLEYVGGLVGAAGNITKSSSSGKVTGNGELVGGLSGASSVFDSFSTCDVILSLTGDTNHSYRVGGLLGRDGGTVARSYATGDVTGYSNVGGLMGYCDWCSVYNNYATGDVTGDTDVGGVVGRMLGSFVEFNYSLGAVTGATNMGAVFGFGSASYDSTSLFYSTDSNPVLPGVGNASPAQVVGKTLAELKTLSTFTGAGFDFVDESANGTSDYWKILTNETPSFAWQP